jgi:hypothetical protein
MVVLTVVRLVGDNAICSGTRFVHPLRDKLFSVFLFFYFYLYARDAGSSDVSSLHVFLR